MIEKEKVDQYYEEAWNKWFRRWTVDLNSLTITTTPESIADPMAEDIVNRVWADQNYPPERREECYIHMRNLLRVQIRARLAHMNMRLSVNRHLLCQSD
jgi:hypothetical protein